MIELGVDREWLAATCGWTKGNVVNVLAPKGSNRSPKAIARIKDALDREEERQRMELEAPKALGHRVVLEPTKAQFDRWTTAAVLSPAGNLDDWAKQGLDAKADRELPELLAARKEAALGESPHCHLKVATDPAPYGEASTNG